MVNGTDGVAARLARVWRSLRWYLQELTGESAYDRYLQHHTSGHAGGEERPPLDRREFERQRWDRATRPGSRCC
jgi:uncharacterized short protein YbdD (DUF466 family)